MWAVLTAVLYGAQYTYDYYKQQQTKKLVATYGTVALVGAAAYFFLVRKHG